MSLFRRHENYRDETGGRSHRAITHKSWLKAKDLRGNGRVNILLLMSQEYISLKERIKKICLLALCLQTAYATAGERCRLALAGENTDSRQLQETLLRSYELSHKKKREQKAFQSHLSNLLTQGLSAKETLNRLLAEGLISPESDNPLFGLILNQQPEMTAQLIENSPETVQSGALLGNPPFFIAVLTGEQKVVETFLKTDPSLISSENSYGESPLHYALESEMADFLLSRGADPNKQDKKGFSPLHHVRSTALAKTLLSYGADWRLKDRSGQPLIRRHETVVRLPEITGLLKSFREKVSERRGRENAPPSPDPEEERRRAEIEEEARRAREADAREEAERKKREQQMRQEEKRQRANARRADRVERQQEEQARAEMNRQVTLWKRIMLAQTINLITEFDTENYSALGPALSEIKKYLLKDFRQKLRKLGGGKKSEIVVLSDENEKLEPSGAEPHYDPQKSPLMEVKGESGPLTEEALDLALKHLREDMIKHVEQRKPLQDSPAVVMGIVNALKKDNTIISQEVSRLRLETEHNSSVIFFLYSLSEQFPSFKDMVGFESFFLYYMKHMETHNHEESKKLRDALVEDVFVTTNSPERLSGAEESL